jgi:hypothetical protein
MAIALAFAWGSVHAALTGGPDIIPVPVSVEDDAPGAENDHQQAFNEKQGVVLVSDIQCDGGASMATGTKVNSHMIFLNTAGSAFASSTATWTFDGDIICVMSDSTGSLEATSTPQLGAASTTYPVGPFAARGMEGNDGYVVGPANTISVTMSVTEPGDWIRVVTKWVDTVPPGSSCVETENPHGKNVPKAPAQGGQGQNQDGFYELLGRDNEPGVEVFVMDIETGTVFGPYVPGTKIKYMEANGAIPSATPMGGNNGNGNGQANDVDWQIKGQGDAAVFAVDAAGNRSTRAACLVPNPPK